MPGVLWTRFFFEAQDYGVKKHIVFLDNETAMLLEKNDKASSGKRTNHIHMNYFFNYQSDIQGPSEWSRG